MTRGIRRSAGAVLVGLLAFALTACGDSGAANESQIRDKLVKELSRDPRSSEEYWAEVADCMAPQMVEQLSDETLEKFMETDFASTASATEIPEEERGKLLAIGFSCVDEE